MNKDSSENDERLQHGAYMVNLQEYPLTSMVMNLLVRVGKFG